MNAKQKRLGLVGALLFLGVPGLIALSVPSASAASDEREATSGQQSSTIPDGTPLPDGMRLAERAANPEQDSPVPEATHRGLWELEVSGAGELFNAYEWDEASETLLAYSASPNEAGAALEKYLPAERTKLMPARHSKVEINEALALLLQGDGTINDSSRVLYAAPSNDGSRITVSVQPSSMVDQLSSGASDRAKKVLESRVVDTGVEIVIETPGQAWTPAIRTIPSAWGSFVAGGGMRTVSGVGCTQGFKMGQSSTGAAGMLSAHHCGAGAGVGANWYNRENVTVANLLGAYQGQHSVVGATTGIGADLGRWTGTGITSKLRAYVATGAYDDPSIPTWAPIKGGTVPITGDRVCYSGSYSGKVCNNVVNLTNVAYCYIADVLCYAGHVTTYQEELIPAVGDGDSGGPIYTSIDGKVYAVGIVSGYGTPAPNCTGEPASTTRSCSVWGMYAPIVYGLNSTTGWGLYVVPD